MNKILDFVKKHLIASIAICVGVVALIVASVSFISSSVSYAQYGRRYESQKKELLANTPQFPEEVYRDNGYVTYDDANSSVTSTKSSYENKYLLKVSDAEISLEEGQPAYEKYASTSWDVATGFTKGGTITYKINTASNGLSDVDIYLGLGEIKNVAIGNIIDFITIKINGLPVTTVDFDLPSSGELQQLVLKNTNLITGENTLEFATSISESDRFIMPAIAAVTFITDVALA